MSNHPNKQSTKRDAILAAAGEQFNQYRFQKTSMEDIAQRLGVSRASLYSYFTNKDDIFRGVSMAIHERALRRVEQHLFPEPCECNPALAIEERVTNALMARHGPFQKAVSHSIHGGELFDEYSRLCGDIVRASHDRFQNMLSKALSQAAREGSIYLKGSGLTGRQTAEILNLSAAGLKHSARATAAYKKRLEKFVAVFLRGLKFSYGDTGSLIESGWTASDKKRPRLTACRLKSKRGPLYFVSLEPEPHLCSNHLSFGLPIFS